MSGILTKELLYTITHTGEVVNLHSTHGANEFLKQCASKDDFDLFSDMIKQSNVIRKKAKKRKNKLTATDKKRLLEIYTTLKAIGFFSDPALFRERVPECEVNVWLDHAATTFQEVSKSQHWIKTGKMMPEDDLLLLSCCHLFKHALPTAIIFENDSFFESVLALLAARKETLTPNNAFAIKTIVGGILATALRRFDHPWEPEKAFKKLDSAGILQHFIRAVAVRQPVEEMRIESDGIFRVLLPCVALIKTRFKAGTPCGDSLRSIFESGMEICPLVKPYLQDLLQLSCTFEANNARAESDCRVCWFCDKEEDKYMICARCQQACYCSKDCQRSDWKRHKPLCLPVTKQMLKTRDAEQMLLADYGNKHFVEIMFTIAEECKKNGGLSMRDVVLELDLIPDENRTIPALQKIPRFKIIPKSVFLQADTEKREQFERFAADPNADLLCSLLYPDSESISGFQSYDPVTGLQMYTEDVLVAFQKAFYEEDCDHLASIFHKQDRWMQFSQQIRILWSVKKTFDAMICLFGTIPSNFVQGETAETANSMVEFLKLQQT